jgi:sugar lactone lactonase YvrE
VCGTGARAYNGDGALAKDAVLDLPASVAFDADGNLYILDQANQVVRRVDSAGIIDRYAGNCVIGKCDAGEIPQACPSSNRTSCLLDTDPSSGCSQPCAIAFEGDGGPAIDARLAQPAGQAADPAGRLAFDADGNLLLADTKNHRIRRIDLAGVITTIAGTGERGHAGDGGPALDAELDNPTDLAIASDGTIYVADTYNSCVRAIGPDGTIETVAGR